MDKYTIRQEMMKDFILLERTIDRMGIVGIKEKSGFLEEDVKCMMKDIIYLIYADFFNQDIKMDFESIAIVAKYMNCHPETWHSFFLLYEMNYAYYTNEQKENHMYLYKKFINARRNLSDLADLLFLAQINAEKYVKEHPVDRESLRVVELAQITTKIKKTKIELGDMGEYRFIDENLVKDMMTNIAFLIMYSSEFSSYGFSFRDICLAARDIHIKIAKNDFFWYWEHSELMSKNQNLPLQFINCHQRISDKLGEGNKNLDKLILLLLITEQTCEQLI